MGMYHSNQLKIGLKVIYNFEPYIVISNEFIKPGKGQEFFRIKFKNLLNQKLIEKTCRSMDVFKSADVLEVIASYIFTDGSSWVFINKKNFEQIFVEKNVIVHVLSWLLPQNDYIITLWNNIPISVVYSNNFIEVEVVNTTSNFKCNTVNSSNKLALLKTGITIKVPTFVRVGQIIKVDTRTNQYVSKMK